MTRMAIAHDWLLIPRGAERVLTEFCLAVQDLSIYTLFLRAPFISPPVSRHSLFVSPFNHLPWVDRYYRYLLPWFGWGIEQLYVDQADVLLSISHSVAKGIPHHPDIPHVCYCLTPMRYLWEPRLYGAELKASWRGTLLKALSSRLKQWDLKSTDSVDFFVAVSETVAKRIRRVYGRDAEVLYPCVDQEFFSPSSLPREEFYLIVSALVPQKRIDLAIEAFKRNGKTLLVVGTGPLYRRLSRMAGPNTRFLGWLEDGRVRELYRRAKGLIFPGTEDFGLVPVEAQACGCPVLAFGEGGTTETVIDGKTGLFFRQPNPDALLAALASFEKVRFDSKEALDNARRFSRPRFRDRWRAVFKKLGLPIRI
ncbi:MAG: glycosyltransferase [Acidobacteriota bacterium]